MLPEQLNLLTAKRRDEAALGWHGLSE